MSGRRYSQEQMKILKENEAGACIALVAHAHGVGGADNLRMARKLCRHHPERLRR